MATKFDAIINKLWQSDEDRAIARTFVERFDVPGMSDRIPATLQEAAHTADRITAGEISMEDGRSFLADFARQGLGVQPTTWPISRRGSITPALRYPRPSSQLPSQFKHRRRRQHLLPHHLLRPFPTATPASPRSRRSTCGRRGARLKARRTGRVASPTSTGS